MSKIGDFWRSGVFWTAIGTIIALCLGVDNACEQRRARVDLERIGTEQSRIEYRSNAAIHRPLLKIVENPRTNQIEFHHRVARHDLEADWSGDSAIGTSPGDVTITNTVEVRNINSVIANYRFAAWSIMNREAETLRDSLLSDERRCGVHYPEHMTSIFPGDTAAISIDHKYRTIATIGGDDEESSSLRYLHVLLVYENDAGHLFDTYYITEFTPLALTLIRSVSKGKIIATMTADSNAVRDYMLPKEVHDASYVYKQAEAQKIIGQYLNK
jgi:hypothetical protein